MRQPPKPENFAARRLHAQLEAKVKDNPVPQRSELVDFMVQQAIEREEEIEAQKAAKPAKSGLQGAQRKPLASDRAKPATTATEAPVAPAAATDDATISFFENLLAPGPASNTDQKDNDNDESN
jgi:hypothetical protein